MCWSNATLFYGLWVTTASLDFAATAHKATRLPILAIDLIVSRRRGGTLEIKQQDEKTTARDLPSEVWELVKDELLGSEVLEAEQERINDFRCKGCAEQDYIDSGVGDWCPCCSKGPEPVLKHAWTRWEMPPCLDRCYDHILESEILHTRTVEQLDSIGALLKHHILQLPSPRLWTKDGEDSSYDFDSLMAIALPLLSTEPTSSTNRGFPMIKASGDHENPSSKVLNFTPEALTVPADADARFRRLVSSYRLKVVDRTHGSGLAPSDPRLSLESLPPTIPATKVGQVIDKKKAETKKEEAPKLFAPAEPRWMMWTMCESCF